MGSPSGALSLISLCNIIFVWRSCSCCSGCDPQDSSSLSAYLFWFGVGFCFVLFCSVLVFLSVQYSFLAVMLQTRQFFFWLQLCCHGCFRKSTRKINNLLGHTACVVFSLFYEHGLNNSAQTLVLIFSPPPTIGSSFRAAMPVTYIHTCAYLRGLNRRQRMSGQV